MSRRGAGRRADAACAQVAARTREVRPAIGREVHELAIEDHAPPADHLGQLGQLWELRAAPAARARTHCPFTAAVQAQLGADAVELDLDRPLALSRRCGRPVLEQHRLNESRTRFNDRLHPAHGPSSLRRAPRPLADTKTGSPRDPQRPSSLVLGQRLECRPAILQLRTGVGAGRLDVRVAEDVGDQDQVMAVLADEPRRHRVA